MKKKLVPLIKVGDLVETCSCMPGFVVWVNPNDPDDIEVQELDKIGKYIPGCGGGHDVKHCGIVKTTTEKAMYQCALGRDKVTKLWDDESFDWNDINAWKKEFEKIRQEQD